MTIGNSARLFNIVLFNMAWETCIYTEFVYPECWHFDNDATSNIDDVLIEHGGPEPFLGMKSKFFFCRFKDIVPIEFTPPPP